MPFYRDLGPNTKLPSTWVDAEEQLLGNYVSPNFAIDPASPTAIICNAGVGTAQVEMAVNGKPRWITAPLTASVPSTPTAQTFNVWACTGADAFGSAGGSTPYETDLTDHSFTLLILAIGSLPSGSGSQMYYRKVGEVVWSGTRILDAYATVWDRSPTLHAAKHIAGALDAIQDPNHLRVSRVTALSVNSGVDTEIHWDSEEYDPQSMHDPGVGSSSHLTARWNGIYAVTAQIAYSVLPPPGGNAGARQIRIELYDSFGALRRVVARQQQPGQAPGWGNDVVQARGEAQMSAGDFVRVIAYQNQASILPLVVGADWTWACMSLVHPT